MKLVRIRNVFMTAVLVAVAVLTLGTASAFAQDATPEAMAMAEPAHPVHIHNGTCDAIADVVFPLNDIVTYNITNSFSFGPAAPADSMATPMAEVSMTETTPVLFSSTHIDTTVADLVTGGFSINAHESAENIQNYIACGTIPACTAPACAAVSGVSIALGPQNASGYFGVARIDNDADGGAIVSVFLFHPEMPASS